MKTKINVELINIFLFLSPLPESSGIDIAKPKAIAPLIHPAKKVIPLSLLSKEKIFNLKILRNKDIPYTDKNLPIKTNIKTRIIKVKQKESCEIDIDVRPK